MNLGVVVLNYNGWKDTIECIESLQKQDYFNHRIIIVDNNSTNNSYERIKSWLNGEEVVFSEFLDKKFEQRKRNYIELTESEIKDVESNDSLNSGNKNNQDNGIVLINCSENFGFSGGNNIGAKYVENIGCDYVLLLNNDTIIIDDKFLSRLIEPLKKSKEVYLTGPNTINFDGTFDSPMIEDTFMGNLFYLSLLNWFRRLLNSPPIYIDIKAISSPKPIPVFKISGACMMFKTERLKEIGYLDESVWLSSEEAIISEKIKSLKGKIFFQPLTTLIHKKAQSPRPKMDRYNILKNHYKQRKYFYINYRNYGVIKMAIINLITMLRLGISKLRN